MVRNVVAIIPVWSEPLDMIQKFSANIKRVQESLAEKGVGFQYFFLDDGAVNLPADYPVLVRHLKNIGLDQTLVDGYREVLNLKLQPDLIIRLDCQEHDVLQIPVIIDHFSNAKISALFLPVWYWVQGQNRPAAAGINLMLADFIKALAPIDKKTVLETYNQKFPIGYQAFRREVLKDLLPKLEKGLDIFKEKTGKPAAWGLDLLVILLAAHNYKKEIDFIFGGWSEPWLENRGADKIEFQRQRAAAVIEVAERLGCVISQ